MPHVELSGDNKNNTPRFYGGIKPVCEGLASNWQYDITTEFCLDANNNEEYHLHMKGTKVKKA